MIFTQATIKNLKVELHHDDMTGYFDHTDQVIEIDYDPVNVYWCDEFDWDFAIRDDSAFMRYRSDWGEWRYFEHTESLSTLQAHYSKMGYAKHDAWLKAIEQVKSEFDYLLRWFNNDWSYVGVVVEELDTDSGDFEHKDSLWGIDWDSYWQKNEAHLIEILAESMPVELARQFEEELYLNW